MRYFEFILAGLHRAGLHRAGFQLGWPPELETDIMNSSMRVKWFTTILVAMMLGGWAASASAQPNNSPLGGTPVVGGVEVPIPPQLQYGLIQPIVDEQEVLIPQLFCVASSQSLWLFDLAASPFSGIDIAASSNDGVGSWTPVVVSQYDWLAGYASGDINLDELLDLLSSSSDAALMIGILDGSCGSAYIIALGMSRVVDGQQVHYLIPVMEVTAEVQELVELVPPGVVVTRSSSGDGDPCDLGFCDQQYRTRISDALLDFADCAKSQVPPFSLRTLGCFVGCVPALAGTPLVYAACVSACTAVMAAAGVIDLTVCEAELTDANQNALASKSACLAWRAANCPGGLE